MSNITQVKCPQCGVQVPWSSASPYRPFCSQRCKTMDLGAWASEDYHLQAQEDAPLSEQLMERIEQ